MSMERSALFPFLATGWAVLWALLSLSNGGFYLDGPQGLGLPVIIVCSGWLLAWLRSGAWSIVSDGQPERWKLVAVGIVPIVLVGVLPLIDHSGRHASRIHDTSVATSVLKVALFASSWVLLLFARKGLTPTRPAAVEESPTAVQPLIHDRPKTDTLLISIGDVLRPISWHQIVWLEADGNYVRIFTHETDYFYRRSLGDLLSELGEDRFVRIHKSRAANVGEIAGIRPLAKGDADLHLRDGRTLRMSRRFRNDLPTAPRS